MTVKYLQKIPACRQAGVLICFFIFVFNISCFAEDYLPYKGIIQVESNVSDGVYPPFKVLNLAKERGIKIVIFSESYLRRWEYGIRPLQNLIKIKEEQPSVVEYGIKRYLKEIDNLQFRFPDMAILGGVEVAPFYWWEGNPFKGKVFNFGWGKHLVVVGLNAKDYAYLPVVSKRYILPQNLKDFILVFIPILVIFLGGILLKLKIKRKILYQSFSFDFPLFPYRFFGYILIVLGIIFLINNFPFSSKYGPYHGDKGYKPYQGFIDYVREKGGFVSWAHPGTGYSQSLGKVDIITFPYFDVLTNTFNYNGFAGIYLGDTSLCLANRGWDTVLKEYCLNKRKNPVWITGEIDYDGTNPKQKIDEIQTVFFLNKLNRDSALEALKKGRFYARTYEDNLYIDLDEFSIDNRLMGETAQIEGKPKLIIKGNANVSPTAKIKLEVIRGGEIIKIYEITKGEFDFGFFDDNFKEFFKKNYYRLNFFLEGRLILASNPIFCEIE